MSMIILSSETHQFTSGERADLFEIMRDAYARTEIEIWGDGEQTRSFMYIDDCITGIDKLMESDYNYPLNLGRSELVTINELLDIVEDIAGVKVKRKYNLNAPQGVRGRNSDNSEIRKVLGWEPEIGLRTGMEKTYQWIEEQFKRRKLGETVVQ